MSAGTTKERTERTIYAAGWTREGELLHFDVRGNGFLYNMVRILVGTMLDAGKGVLPPDAVRRALESGRRADAGATAPAHGLTLWRVRYADLDTERRLLALCPAGEARP